MVRFQEHALIIEIPCRDESPVEYYEGLQNALYEVFWLGNSQGEPNSGLSWMAAYLGPAVAVLEPAARIALNSLHPAVPIPDVTGVDKTELLERLIQRLDTWELPLIQHLYTSVAGMSGKETDANPESPPLPLSADGLTDRELLRLLENMPTSRFVGLLQHFGISPK